MSIYMSDFYQVDVAFDKTFVTLYKSAIVLSYYNSTLKSEVLKAGVHTFPKNAEIAVFDASIKKSDFMKAEEGGYSSEAKESSSYADRAHDHFPVGDAKHARLAVGMFGRHKFSSPENKRATARRIMSAAKKHGIEVSDDSPVARAAKGD